MYARYKNYRRSPSNPLLGFKANPTLRRKKIQIEPEHGSWMDHQKRRVSRAGLSTEQAFPGNPQRSGSRWQAANRQGTSRKASRWRRARRLSWIPQQGTASTWSYPRLQEARQSARREGSISGRKRSARRRAEGREFLRGKEQGEKGKRGERAGEASHQDGETMERKRITKTMIT